MAWLAGQLRQWRDYRGAGWSHVREFKFVFAEKQQRWKATLIVEIKIQDLFNSY